MFRLIVRQCLIVTTAMGLAASVTLLAAPAASAAGVHDSIVGYTVTCDGTWTDPGTGEVHEIYGVTATFTHAGPRELRIYETAGAGYIDSDHGWFQGQGSDTFALADFGRRGASSARACRSICSC